MFKIYIDNRSVLLNDKCKHNSKNSVFAHSIETIWTAYKDFISGPETELHLYCEDVDFLFTVFCSMFDIVEAAGGLVENDGKYLFIFRRGKWDLPKGKIDDGEVSEQAALREVNEECGLSELTANGLLTTTYHIYTHKGRQVLKPTYWYRMQSSDVELTPQTEEDIEIAEWRSIESFDEIVNNTYPSIIDVLMSAGF